MNNITNGFRFDEATHTYYLGKKKLISVTQLMQKHNLTASYDAIPQDVLERAANYGTLVHEEIETYLKEGETGFSWELFQFKNWYDLSGARWLESEKSVHNDIVAGTIDFIYDTQNLKFDELILADFKTVSDLKGHLEGYRWQLSIYKYLYELTYNVNISKLQIFWFNKRKQNLEIVELEPIETSTIESLLNAEREGLRFAPSETLVEYESTDLSTIKEAAAHIKELKATLEMWENTYSNVETRLLEEMNKRGLTEFEKDGVKLKVKKGKKAYIRNDKKIDLEKFESEHPDEFNLYKSYEYTKEVEVKASPDKLTIEIEESE